MEHERGADRKADRGEGAIIEQHLGLVVKHLLGRQAVVMDRERKAGAAADVQCKARIESAVAAGPLPQRDQDALPYLAVGPDLRQTAPISLRKAHLLAGHRFFDRCGNRNRRGGCDSERHGPADPIP